MCGRPQIERDRGRKEAGQQLEVLRERWPLAFPVQAQDVCQSLRDNVLVAFLLGRRAYLLEDVSLTTKDLAAKQLAPRAEAIPPSAPPTDTQPETPKRLGDPMRASPLQRRT
jgi:hypothetical protein